MDGSCVMDVVVGGSRVLVSRVSPVVVVLAVGMGPVVAVTADELDVVVIPVTFPAWRPADTRKENIYLHVSDILRTAACYKTAQHRWGRVS